MPSERVIICGETLGARARMVWGRGMNVILGERDGNGRLRRNLLSIAVDVSKISSCDERQRKKIVPWIWRSICERKDNRSQDKFEEAFPAHDYIETSSTQLVPLDSTSPRLPL